MIPKPSKQTEMDKFSEANSPFYHFACMLATGGAVVGTLNLAAHLLSGPVDPVTAVAYGALALGSAGVASVLGKKLMEQYEEAKANGLDAPTKVLKDVPSKELLDEARTSIGANKASAIESAQDLATRLTGAPPAAPMIRRPV